MIATVFLILFIALLIFMVLGKLLEPVINRIWEDRSVEEEREALMTELEIIRECPHMGEQP